MASKKEVAVDCKFGTAQVGDLLPLPGPIFDTELIAKLVKVDDQKPGVHIHTYDLYVVGVWVGRAQAAVNNDGKTYWMEVE